LLPLIFYPQWTRMQFSCPKPFGWIGSDQKNHWRAGFQDLLIFFSSITPLDMWVFLDGTNAGMHSKPWTNGQLLGTLLLYQRDSQSLKLFLSLYNYFVSFWAMRYSCWSFQMCFWHSATFIVYFPAKL
jgi:hypothetical protein